MNASYSEQEANFFGLDMFFVGAWDWSNSYLNLGGNLDIYAGKFRGFLIVFSFNPLFFNDIFQ